MTGLVTCNSLMQKLAAGIWLRGLSMRIGISHHCRISAQRYPSDPRKLRDRDVREPRQMEDCICDLRQFVDKGRVMSGVDATVRLVSYRTRKVGNVSVKIED